VMPSLESEAANQLKTAWDSESDGSAVQLRINISPYTR
jgi:hypothetical protein